MTGRTTLVFFFLLVSTSLIAQTPAAFDGVTRWQGALTPATMASLKDMYSTNPPAMFAANGEKPAPGISHETDFWQQLVSSGATDFDVHTVKESNRQGLHIATLAVSLKIKTPDGPRTRYVNEQQAWQQQAEGWRIVVVTHSDVVNMPPALHPNPNLAP